MRFSVQRHRSLLHRLEQCRLSLCRGAVDLIPENEIGEQRSRPETECRAAQQVHAGDVRRHQVRGELNSPKRQRGRLGEGAHQERFGGSRWPLEQHVSASQQGEDRLADRGGLAEDDLFDCPDQRRGGDCGGRRVFGAYDRISDHKSSTRLAADSTAPSDPAL